MKLFNSDKDRELWIKLNAERQIESDKRSKFSNRLNPRTMEEALEISRNQLEYDENEGKLRFTLEELLTLEFGDLAEIQQKYHIEFLRKLSAM